MATVYLHKFPDGKFYVGATNCEPGKRWANGNGYSAQPKVAGAIKRFKWENVEHFTYTVSDINEAERLETFLINVLDSINNGYNTLKSSDGKKGELYITLGEIVKKRRNAKNMTQEELGKQIGLTKAMVSRIEDGKAKVMVNTMFRLITVLGITAEEIDQIGS